ncbi:MAG: hypothetical protein SV062_03090, partial [Thermodesulfobacteriota bacterium]|nr:hypothetical protein [Thermodesulfobacteriota bacterium]
GASMAAKKNGLSEGLIKVIDSIRGDLVELESLLKTKADYQQLQSELEKIIEDLIGSCEKGEEELALGYVKKLEEGINGLKTNLGLDKAKSLINGNGFTLIGTGNEKGKIDIAFAGSATIIDDKQLIISQMMLGRTVDNLKANKNLTVIGFKINEENPMATEIARVYCTLVKEEMEGPFFNQVKQEVSKEAGDKVADLIKRAYLFKIDEIRISGGQR